MPRKKAEETKSKEQEIKPEVEHNRLCMTVVVPGSACNCPVSLQG